MLKVIIINDETNEVTEIEGISHLFLSGIMENGIQEYVLGSDTVFNVADQLIHVTELIARMQSESPMLGACYGMMAAVLMKEQDMSVEDAITAAMLFPDGNY